MSTCTVRRKNGPLITAALLGVLSFSLPLLYLGTPSEFSDFIFFLAVGSGVCALTFLSFSGVLSLRRPWMERWIGNLGSLYSFHHQLAVTAIALIVFHVAFLSLSQADYYYLKIWKHSDKILFGWLSFILLIAVAAGAAFLDRKSHFWRAIHLLSLPAVILGIVHFFSLTSAEGWVKYLLLFLFLPGLAAIFLRTSKYIFSIPYQVSEVEHLGKQIVAIKLLPAIETRLHHHPSQFVFAAFHNGDGFKGCNEFHPYTITSLSTDPYLELIVKSRGDCSCNIQTVNPGVPAHIEGPFGGFDSPPVPTIWIGGGVGVTPFIPMLKAAHELGLNEVDLFYVERSEEDHVMKERLEKAVEGKLNLRVHLIVTKDDSKEIVRRLEETVPDFIDRCYILSGPPPLINGVKEILIKKGLDKRKISFESFGGK